jgi:L-ascorbate metabolism protein UlaG (beta-lactamase superfamily)
MLYLFTVIFGIVIIIALYINLHPTFGGAVSKEDKRKLVHLENYSNGKFLNQKDFVMNFSLSTAFSFLKDSIGGNKKERKPPVSIPVFDPDWELIKENSNSLTWFGHSTLLLSMENKKILLDPVFGSVPSPVTFAGSKRYSEDLLHIIDKLPLIDAVLITHDHYDHLDYPSIVKLKDKVEHFFVPLGVRAHLQRWGIEANRISELNWWEEVHWQGLTIGAVPSQHFSGRGLFNRNSTLWAGWVILGQNLRLYTSGDGGYGPHFQQIGEKYGPFDLTLMEGGQYDRRWPYVHMMPEQSVQAHLDVRGRMMMLIHWGAFTLAFHRWYEPIERAMAEAQAKDVNIIAPKIGQTIILEKNAAFPEEQWWKSLS